MMAVQKTDRKKMKKMREKCEKYLINEAFSVMLAYCILPLLRPADSQAGGRASQHSGITAAA